MVDAGLLKSDGMPTYHLASERSPYGHYPSAVGSNSAKTSASISVFWMADAELPLLRNPDKSKLSKRKNPTSVLYYQRMGFLPEALVNYLGRMGWSMPDDREKFSLRDMQAVFDIDRVSIGGPIFDVEKLKWLNALWLRENFDREQVKKRLKVWLWNDETLDKILPLAQGRMEVLSDFVYVSISLVGRSPSTLLHWQYRRNN